VPSSFAGGEGSKGLGCERAPILRAMKAKASCRRVPRQACISRCVTLCHSWFESPRSSVKSVHQLADTPVDLKDTRPLAITDGFTSSRSAGIEAE